MSFTTFFSAIHAVNDVLRCVYPLFRNITKWSQCGQVCLALRLAGMKQFSKVIEKVVYSMSHEFRD